MKQENSSITTIPTENASKYLQQVCKHWQHRMDVQFTPQEGTIIFPKNARGNNWPGEATVKLNTEESALVCEIAATAEGQLAGIKKAVEVHLDRFAFREAPLTFNWQDQVN